MRNTEVHRSTLWLAVLAIGSLFAAPGCQGVYYSAMEAFGQHKRDLLVGRVAEARDEQEEAKEQFKSALEKFTDLVGMPDTDLRRTYDELNSELERSESKAKDVTNRIDSIESVGDDLFREWEKELDQYTSEDLRRSSRRTMEDTRRYYEDMVVAMRRPEAKMDAVLVNFRDHVLYLKHNLNAQAVASLAGTVDALEFDTAQLIREMEAAIAEADRFIRTMDSTA